MENKRNRMRRVLAFLIDFVVLYIPCALVLFVLRALFPFNYIVFIGFVLGIAFFVTFILRDYLFNGHSVGKQIFKLKVVDSAMGSKPSTKQLVVKGLFLFLYPIDGFFLILSGKSLSERATCTTVLREQPLSDTELSKSTSLDVPAPRRVFLVATAALCISVPLYLITSASLISAKQQENYKIAHTYLLNSKACLEMQADEAHITLIGHSSNTMFEHSDNTTSTAETFVFLVKGQQFKVTCHKNGDIWYICNECTAFQ